MSALLSFIISFFYSSYITSEVIRYRMDGPRPKPPARNDDLLCKLKREARIRGEHIAS